MKTVQKYICQMKKSVYVISDEARQLNGLQALSCLADIKPNISI